MLIALQNEQGLIQQYLDGQCEKKVTREEEEDHGSRGLTRMGMEF
jgi:hypothetical protein